MQGHFCFMNDPSKVSQCFSKLWKVFFVFLHFYAYLFPVFLLLMQPKFQVSLLKGKVFISLHDFNNLLHLPHDKPFKSQRGLKKDSSPIHKNTYRQVFHFRKHLCIRFPCLVSSRTILTREHNRVAWSFMYRVKPWQQALHPCKRHIHYLVTW